MRNIEIDVAQIIEQKSGRKLPNFAIKLIKGLIHEGEINDILRRLGHLKGNDFLWALLQDFGTEVRWRHAERLPESGRAIFVCNHPLGAIDGIGITHLLAERYGSVQYLVNDMLYYLEPLQSVFLPVNTYGKQKKEHIEAINCVLASDTAVGTFPAGWCSRYQKGKVQDSEWKSSFVNMAIKYERDIVPLHFVGKNSRHFYLLDRMRKALGIKFDFCTALLSDEMFRQRGKSFEVIVGDAISWQSLKDHKLSPKEQAAQIRALSYALNS